jgi:hypothetical protein
MSHPYALAFGEPLLSETWGGKSNLPHPQGVHDLVNPEVQCVLTAAPRVRLHRIRIDCDPMPQLISTMQRKTHVWRREAAT